MIRFKTIEPETGAMPAKKPLEKPATPPAVTETGADPAEEPAAASKSKGLARKTPLRAKKPDAARVFRD